MAKQKQNDASGQVFVAKTYKDRGVVSREEGGESEQIKVQPIAGDVPLASVESASQMTLNLGNFESVQIRVGVTLPCYVEELDDAYMTAQKFVEQRLNKEVTEIREYRASRSEEKSND